MCDEGERSVDPLKGVGTARFHLAGGRVYPESKDLTAKLLPSRSIGQPDCDYFLLYQKSRCCVRERRSSTIAVQSFEFYHQARPRLTLIRFGLSVHAEVGSSVVAVS